MAGLINTRDSACFTRNIFSKDKSLSILKGHTSWYALFFIYARSGDMPGGNIQVSGVRDGYEHDGQFHKLHT